MWTTPPERLRQQRGVGIIAALVVTVVLASLAILLTRLTATQSLSVALDERGVRAYWAARSGLDWGSWQIKNGNPGCTNGSFDFPADTTFKLQVTCSQTDNTYLITAKACSPACTTTDPRPATYVERVITRVMQWPSS